MTTPSDAPMEPDVTTLAGGDTEHRHPAFAVLSASRRKSNAALYGVDYDVEDQVHLRIDTSHAVRRLSKFSYFDDDCVVEIAMSAAQWAAFVSSPNVGSGVPVTMVRREGEPVPRILRVREDAEIYESESDAAIEKGLRALDELQAGLAAVAMSKATRRDIETKIDAARRSIGSSQDHVRRSFANFIHRKTEGMKANLHAYAEGLLHGLRGRAVEDRSKDGGETASMIEGRFDT